MKFVEGTNAIWQFDNGMSVGRDIIRSPNVLFFGELLHTPTKDGDGIESCLLGAQLIAANHF
jgi:hypothetical protein